VKILVTGAFGFLGGRLAAHFLHEGHEVLLGTRRQITPKAARLEHGTVVRICWTDRRNLEEACAGLDVIVHASGMNAQDCALDPVGALEVNTVATARLLGAALTKGVRRFIYVSTVHVYTDYLHGTISEQSCPSNLHPYAASAKAAEDVVLYAQKQKLIDGVVIRLSNGYGVPVHPTVNCWMLLVNSLCRQVVETGQLRLSSDGSQVRDFISMQEICAVVDFLACRTSLRTNIGGAGPVNVGSRTPRTVLEMADVVQARCKTTLGLATELVVKRNPDTPPSPRFDFRLQRLLSLGYKFVHDPTDEIDDLLRYCQREFSRS